MQIQSVNSLYTKPSFKAAYPVIHWTCETNGSYAPVISYELTKKLQGKLVRALNKVCGLVKVDGETLRIQDYLRKTDFDYRFNQKVRSFYNPKAEESDVFEPISYIISGKDAVDFDTNVASNIGREKHYAKTALGTPYSAEANIAINNYLNQGVKLIYNKASRIKGNDNRNCALNTKFEIIRDRNGKIKDYKLKDVRFMPETGKDSPIEKYTSLKKA